MKPGYCIENGYSWRVINLGKRGLVQLKLPSTLLVNIRPGGAVVVSIIQYGSGQVVRPLRSLGTAANDC